MLCVITLPLVITIADASIGNASTFPVLTRILTRCSDTGPNVVLAWRGTGASTSFEIERRDEGTLEWNVVGSVPPKTRLYVDIPAAIDAGTYVYRVLAVSGRVRSASNSMEVNIPPCSETMEQTPTTTNALETLISRVQARRNQRLTQQTSAASTRASIAPLRNSSSSQRSAMTIPPSTVPVPAGKIRWGAYTGDNPSTIDAFTSKIGSNMHYVAMFVGGEEEFPTAFARAAGDRGLTLVIFWEPHDMRLDAIAAGTYDEIIRTFAAGAAAYGKPVIFAPFHEMNGDWNTWSGVVGSNTPQKLIAAWRHVHELFADAPNVAFGWAVNNDSIPDTANNAIGSYYPGDAYVDYAGIDGFNFNDPWMSFSEVFASALSRVSTYGKPIILFSMASAEGPRKAAWITDAFTVQIPKYPLVEGWIWFNENKERDWRVWSDDASLKAFQKALRSL